MNVGSSFGAEAQAAEVFEPGEGAFHGPAGGAEAGAVFGAAAGDDRGDAAGAGQTAVLIVVVAAVGVEPLGPEPWLADYTSDRWNGVEQRNQLGDVVAMTAG